MKPGGTLLVLYCSSHSRHLHMLTCEGTITGTVKECNSKFTVNLGGHHCDNTFKWVHQNYGREIQV